MIRDRNNRLTLQCTAGGAARYISSKNEKRSQIRLKTFRFQKLKVLVKQFPLYPPIIL